MKILDNYMRIVFQSIVMHMLHHVPHHIKTFGPAWCQWMFSYERSNQRLIQSITKPKDPELSAIKRQEVQTFNFSHYV